MACSPDFAMDNSLFENIKFNCDVSDARFWGSFSICGLLMRYRDLYRSEQGRQPWAAVTREEIGPWIQRKEGRWPDLEGEPFRDLPAGGLRCGPFDSESLNRHLLPEGLVYGAGYGMYLKPTFFLARSVSTETVEGHTVQTTDQELIRDLFTAPAMLQERTITLRREAVRAMLWDRFCPLRPGGETALEEAFAAWDIRPGQAPDTSFARDLERMVTACCRMLLHHELAESREALPGWKDLLSGLQDRKAEIFLRSVQDLVADLSDDGPLRRIIAAKDAASLALFIGLPEGYRRSAAADLGKAYLRFRSDRDWPAVEAARRAVLDRFAGVRQKARELFARGGRDELLAGLAEEMRRSER